MTRAISNGHGKRLASAMILLPIFVLIVWFGGRLTFNLLVVGVAGIALKELCDVVRAGGLTVPTPLVVGGGLGLVIITVLGGVNGLALGAAALVMLALLQGLLTAGDLRARVVSSALAVLIVGYVGGLLSFLVLLRGLPEGQSYVLFLCGVVWTADTAAFYVGRTFGRRPLAPSISPRKTVEGALAGVAAGMGAALLLRAGLDLGAGDGMSLLAGASLVIVGQVGDLAESFLKRAFGVKDVGRLIPGHGGLLDRIDAILFAAPVLYGWTWVGLL